MTLKSIRGATTVTNDENSITERSVELIKSLYAANSLKDNDVVNIVISTTSDITAFYPARAIRESGVAAPVFSVQEPSIGDALPLCVRIMITAYTKNSQHIYLHGAKVLRPEYSALNIAIDGPSGAGKSTVAKMVASELGITYLDTGALYRSLGLKALRRGIKIERGEKMNSVLNETDVQIVYENGVQKVLLDGEDVSTDIRAHEVSKAASDISAISEVRAKLLDLQRITAACRAVVLDGRDIGTVVLPDADFKFFLTASAEERARRRFNELKLKGDVRTYDTIFEDIKERDKNDSTRAIAPLKKAVDAIEINSDNLSAEEVANIIIKAVKEKK